MNHVRNITLSTFILIFAVRCGGSDKPEPQVPPMTSSMPTTPTDSAAKGTDVGTPHEGHAASGADAAGTGTAGTGATGATGATGTTGDTTGAPSGGAALTDEQILQVTHVANTGEVEQAKLAQQKAKDPKVKKFAAMMIKDHTDADTKGNDVAKKNKLTPSDSPASTTLKADGDKTVEQLKGQTGAEFDRAYMDAQVKAHQTVLDTIDNKLMPSVKSADVKSMLQAVRPKVEAHLKEAQDIQKSLSASK